MENQEFSLEQKEVQKYIGNRYPLSLIDFVQRVIPGVCAAGFRDLTDQDWFFENHFPGNPIMPGVLQIEAISQLCAIPIAVLPENEGRLLKLVRVEKAAFYRELRPGDRLDMAACVVQWKRGIARLKGTGAVDGALACKAEIILMAGDALEGFNMRKD